MSAFDQGAPLAPAEAGAGRSWLMWLSTKGPVPLLSCEAIPVRHDPFHPVSSRTAAM